MKAAVNPGSGGFAARSPRLIILDRDGVINADSDDYIRSADEFRPLPGSLAAIVRLKRAGKLVAIATNQSGLARGYFDEAALAAMHAKLRRELKREAAESADAREGARGGDGETFDWIDRIVFCPHGPGDGCECRKPRPGMLLEILKSLRVAPEEAVFVGDSLTDLQAARAAGVAPILVRTGKGERTLALRESSRADETRAAFKDVPVFQDLAAVTGDLLAISVDLL